jgi:hypothetical protein
MSLKDFVQENFNSGAEIKYSERKITLTDSIEACDFLKIDTDGFDLKVLHGAEGLLAKAIHRPVAILVEADLHGDPKNGDSSFAGIDQYLREQGYTLLDVSLERYERAALPRKFRYGIVACSENGPVGFCDATYVDDPLSQSGKFSGWLETKSGGQRLLKLVALYDILGFQDCAAELVVAMSRHPTTCGLHDWGAMLRLIDPDYEHRIARFMKDPKAFA